jgi:hypothetical protein
MQKPENPKLNRNAVLLYAFFGFILLSFVWAFLLGLGDPVRISLALVTLTCSLCIGSLIGFVITIFGDELEALGKARDSMIALLSGITGVGVAKTAELGGLLGKIQLFPQQNERSSWFSVLFVSTYTIIGFYGMYFFRKLILNPALAEAHDRLEHKTELSDRVSEVLTEIEKKLPRSIWGGHEEIEEKDAQDDDFREIKAALLSDEVEELLKICQDEVSKGTLSMDFISKASILHYYRIRFFPLDSRERKDEIDKSLEWLTRAAMIDPVDPEPQLKMAVVYGLLDEDSACISILEKLEYNEESPQYLDQWLGFYLLYGENREEDAIKHTMDYLKRFPNDNGASTLNISRAYAQMCKREINSEATDTAALAAEYRVNALAYLKKAITLDPDLKTVATELAVPGESFEAFAKDSEFLEITKTAATGKDTGLVPKIETTH